MVQNKPSYSLHAPVLLQMRLGQRSERRPSERSERKEPDPKAQRELVRRATNGSMTCEQTAKAVRQRRGKAKPKPCATHLTFTTEDGFKVVVSANRKGRYEEVEQALCIALDEVRHRIRNNVQLF